MYILFSCVQRKSGAATYWWCCVRRRNHRCPATVIQRGQDFSPGNKTHIHPPEPGGVFTTRLKAKVLSNSLVFMKYCMTTALTSVMFCLQVKSYAKEHVFCSASAVVEHVMADLQPTNSFIVPNPTNLVRQVNRARQTLRPKEPTDVNFQVMRETLLLFSSNFILMNRFVPALSGPVAARRSESTEPPAAKYWFRSPPFGTDMMLVLSCCRTGGPPVVQTSSDPTLKCPRCTLEPQNLMLNYLRW